ncbi:MAG: DUF3311 domain-containing protein [Chloroflexi bacterium]|nr:DUF3311 domain-containing protein [Chloroflexota bacterium]
MYAFQNPTLAGIPFYYWWQMLWIILGGLICATVYFVTR